MLLSFPSAELDFRVANEGEFHDKENQNVYVDLGGGHCGPEHSGGCANAFAAL